MALRLAVRVTPRASHHQLSRSGDMLRMRLPAAPVKGAANRALVEALAAKLGLPMHAVRIIRGSTAREKTIEIDGLESLDEVWRRLGL